MFGRWKRLRHSLSRGQESVRLIWGSAFILTILAIIWGAISQHSPKEWRSIKEQQEQQKDVTKNTENPSPSSAKGVYSECPNNCRHEPKEDWWTRLRTDPVATFTGLLFVATLLLFWATRNLVNGAEESSKRQLRAYLGIKSQTIRRVGHNEYQAVITIENTGQTPAHNVRRFLEVGVGSEDRPDNGFSAPVMSQKMPLAPRAEWTIRKVFRAQDMRLKDIPLIAMKGANRFALVWENSNTMTFTTVRTT